MTGRHRPPVRALPLHLRPRPLRIDSAARWARLRTSPFADDMRAATNSLRVPLVALSCCLLLALVTRDHAWIGFTYTDISGGLQ